MTASRLSPEALNALVDSGDLAGLVAPAVWMPVIAGMGGNAGTQVLAVTVRRLAVGRISRRRAWAVIGKEVLVGFINGLANGLVVAIVAVLVHAVASSMPCLTHCRVMTQFRP